LGTQWERAGGIEEDKMGGRELLINLEDHILRSQEGGPEGRREGWRGQRDRDREK
jgi:hypothetical protein